MSNLPMQYSPFSQLLPHGRDWAAVFEDGEDFLGQRGKVISVTFVDTNTSLKRYRGSSQQPSPAVW